MLPKLNYFPLKDLVVLPMAEDELDAREKSKKEKLRLIQKMKEMSKVANLLST